MWETASGRKLATFRGYGAPIYSVAFSPDGRWVANGGQAQTATVWEAVSGRLLLTLKGHTGAVWCVAFSPDGHRLVTGNDAAAKRMRELQLVIGNPESTAAQREAARNELSALLKSPNAKGPSRDER